MELTNLTNRNYEINNKVIQEVTGAIGHIKLAVVSWNKINVIKYDTKYIKNFFSLIFFHFQLK